MIIISVGSGHVLLFVKIKFIAISALNDTSASVGTHGTCYRSVRSLIRVPSSVKLCKRAWLMVVQQSIVY
jgi:hypothetical protein